MEFPNPEKFFGYFMSLGFYLDDLCLEPVNYKNNKERDALRTQGITPLADRIRACSPEIIVCVMKGIEPHVRKAVKLAGLFYIPFYCLPFPSHGNQKRYVAGLSSILKTTMKEKS